MLIQKKGSYSVITLRIFVCMWMEIVTSCIIHERITQKLRKCSYIENKEAARQAVHMAIFM